MTILGLDSSSKYFSLLVAKDDKILSSLYEPFGRELSSKIIPSIKYGLKKSKLSLEDIDYFAVGLGPGSFTGLRVGAATIKGLAFSQKKAVAGVSSLDIIAYGALSGDDTILNTAKSSDNVTICPMVDAKRFLVYSAIYKLRNGCLKRRSGYFLIAIEELVAKLKMEEKVIFIGDGLFLYRGYLNKKLGKTAYFIDENLWYPKMANIFSYLKEKIDKKEFLDLHKIAPLYLYPKECQIKPLKT